MTGHLNFGRALRLSASKHGQRAFLEYGAATHTYRIFNEQVNAVAAWLRSHGIRTGDRLLIVSGNSPDYLRVMFAAGKLGVTTVPTSSMLRAGALANLIEVAAPALMLVSKDNIALGREAISQTRTTAPRLQTIGEDHFRWLPQGSTGPDGFDPQVIAEPLPDRPVSDDDPGSVLFTSGSSGAPKGVVKSYANLMWHALNHQISEPRVSADRELFALPLTGIGFANFILNDVLAGAACILEPFEAERVAAILELRNITHAFLAPTMMTAIERRRPNQSFPTVRVVETAYEMPLSQREMAVRQFPNARILYSYGMSEGSMARSGDEFFLTDLSRVGYANGLDEYRVVNGTAGDDELREIVVGGPSVMLGYLATDEQSDPVRDGWFYTGDLGWIDSDFACHFGGRAKDMIKSGGVSVFANDVESALVDHPGVAAVAVVGVPDEYWGEAVVAVIEPAVDALDFDDLRAFARDHLSGYQLPKVYYRASRIPLNQTGKVAKGEVRSMLERGEFGRID